jgi:hypothetical protein
MAGSNAPQSLPAWRTIFIEKLRPLIGELDDWSEPLGPFGLYNDGSIALFVRYGRFWMTITPYIHGVGFIESIDVETYRASGNVLILPGQNTLYVTTQGRYSSCESLYVLEGDNFIYRLGMSVSEYDYWEYDTGVLYFSDSFPEFMRQRAHVDAAHTVEPDIFNTVEEAIAALENLNLNFGGTPRNLQPFQFAEQYIIPDSHIRYLTEDDIRHLSTEQLRLARNEIFARHGRLFQDAALQAYFDARPWYDGYINPTVFDNLNWPSIRNSYEHANTILLRDAESRR